MDFQQAIDAHVYWKTKLAKYIAKPDRTLDADAVGRDGDCELGRWLKGEGKRHAAMPEFAQLVADHARFHRAAAAILRKANSGQNVTKETALGSKTEYAATSNAVVSSLMKLRSKLRAA